MSHPGETRVQTPEDELAVTFQSVDALATKPISDVDRILVTPAGPRVSYLRRHDPTPLDMGHHELAGRFYFGKLRHRGIQAAP
jgi:hypothetical protein